MEEKQSDKKEKKKEWKWCLKQAIFGIIWIGIILKLFVIDWDMLLIKRYFPSIEWILNYKILFFVVVIIATSKLKLYSIIINILYFIFFPFIWLFVVIPGYLIFKCKWNMIISYLNTVIIFFKNFRYKLVMAILYGVILILSINTSNSIILIIAIIFNIFCICGIIKFSFKLAFKEPEIYELYKKIVDTLMCRKIDNEEEYINVKDKDELKNNTTAVTILEKRVLVNRMLLFSAKKLKKYRDTKSYALQQLVLFSAIVIISALSYSIINYSLFVLEPSNYKILENTPQFIDFISYTFCCSSGYIIPWSTLAKIMEILKAILVFALFGSFISNAFEVNKNKQQEGLDEIIKMMNEGAKLEESKIVKKDVFDDIDEAIQMLQQVKSTLIGTIQKITDNM